MSRWILAVVAGLLLSACSSPSPGGTDPGGSGGGGAGSGGAGGTGGHDGPDDGGCGDGVIDDWEECDAGNFDPQDCCDDDCHLAEPTCGNGHVECAEDCDDGNTEAGDGCSAMCKAECLRDPDCDGDLGEVCVRGGYDQYGVCRVEGRWCDGDAQCPGVDPERCGFDACYCHASPAAGEHVGVCWRRQYALGPCETDEECGASDAFERPARCVALQCDRALEKLCVPLELPGRSCPPGLVPGTADDPRGDVEGYCVPPEGSCWMPEPCDQDADCRDPALPVCDLGRGLCIGGCSVDPAAGTTPTCPPAKPACHALSERVDPNLLNDCATAPFYGAGKCGLECETDADCAHRGNDVNGEPFVCRVRGGRQTCAPRGCLDDAECPDAPGAFVGYCDPYRQACIFDRCRLGLDPRDGCGLEELYDDCGEGFACVADGSGSDTGACEPVTP